MKDRCREIEEQVARLEAEIEGYGQESAHFKSAEESVRLAKLIEQGREEIARLMREWEETAKVVEENEIGVGDSGLGVRGRCRAERRSAWGRRVACP